MALPLVLAPLLKGLAANGLGMLASAIQAKGKDAIEKTLGVQIPDSPGGLTPEKLEELRRLEFEHEEKLLEFAIKDKELEIEAEKAAGQQVTDRWKADMASDSWLSKNVRPMVLIFLLGAYTVFSIASAFDININQAYVELLAQWGMLVMSAYFVGRTVEKSVSLRERVKK